MAFAKVQTPPDIVISSGTGNTATISPVNPVTTGNTIVGYCILQNNAATGLTVVDNNAVPANAVLLGIDTLSSQERYCIFWKTNVTGSPTSYTATASGFTAGTLLMWMEEYSGFTSGAVGNGTGFANLNSTTGANSMVTSSVTTTSNGDFVWSCGHVTLGTDALTAGTVPAFTLEQNRSAGLLVT